MKKVFSVLDRIFEIASPILFLAFGIFVLCFSGMEYVDNNSWILCTFLIVSGAACICDFIGGHKIKHEFNFDIAFGICSIALGIIFMAADIDLKTICLIWGIFEIIEGAFELQHLIVLLNHKDFIAIIEVVVAVLKVIFGILLCVHTEEDIKVHLIVVGVVFILSAIAQVLHTIIEHREKKEINKENKE